MIDVGCLGMGEGVQTEECESVAESWVVGIARDDGGVGCGAGGSCIFLTPNRYPLAPVMMAVITIAIAVRRQRGELTAVRWLMRSGTNSSFCIKTKSIIAYDCTQGYQLAQQNNPFHGLTLCLFGIRA